jgi:cytidine deaminase
MTNEALLKLAYEATEKSYAPYSNFKVGAALLTKEGKVFTGCNVECASFGGTNCAERTAVFKAVSEGYHDFVKIAVVSAGEAFTYPCGICRQVLNEFAPGIDIVMDDHGKVMVVNLKEMLPYSFGPTDLK